MKGILYLLCALLMATTAQAETIKTAGSGGMISLMTDLAQAFMAKNPGETVDVWKESIEAKGGIMGTSEGKLDIGMAARPLSPEENALGLHSTEIARVAAVITVNADSVKLSSLKSTQVCDIYAGKIKNWKDLGGHDAAVKVFTRPEADSTKLAMRKGLKCFTGVAEGSHVTVMPKAQDMYNALTNNANAIGVVDMVAIDDSKGKLRALSLDDIVPSEESVKAGKWLIVKNYVLVTKGAPKGLAKKFIDFIMSPDGTKIIVKNKAIPVR